MAAKKQDVVIFKRVEKKYLLTPAEYRRLTELIADRLRPDEYGESTVCSLYLDTPTHRLVRDSLDAKTDGRAYKEKLRIRSYGTPDRDSKVFFEIKKKYEGVVYKRRVSMTLGEAQQYLRYRLKPKESQIMNEIDWSMHHYGCVRPAMLIAYERRAFVGKEDDTLRVTFDRNLRYRDTNLALESGSGGTPLLPDGHVLMEIKTAGAMPLWLAGALDVLAVFPDSFSKYGAAYRETLTEHDTDDPRKELHYA